MHKHNNTNFKHIVLLKDFTTFQTITFPQHPQYANEPLRLSAASDVSGSSNRANNNTKHTPKPKLHYRNILQPPIIRFCLANAYLWPLILPPLSPPLEDIWTAGGIFFLPFFYFDFILFGLRSNSSGSLYFLADCRNNYKTTCLFRVRLFPPARSVSLY